MFLLMCLRRKRHIITHFYYPHILVDTKKKKQNTIL